MQQFSADPTHNHLEAAILDQVIAGHFRNKRYAFVPVIGDDDEYHVGIAVENEPGYNAISGGAFQWKRRVDAEAFCKGMNLHIGLSERDAVLIISTTMRSTIRHIALVRS